MLKVNLIVVSGKPEGKVIPVAFPVFRIGRDESCNLKPNSVEVSRRHTEITITETAVTVQDLGSRNGTFVNGNLLTGPHRLKSGELMKVGPLTFAVSIQETPASIATLQSDTPPAVQAAPVRPASLDEAPAGQIDSWLVADNARPTPDRPSGVYDGDTLTIDAYTGGMSPPKSNPGVPVSKSPTPPPQPAAPEPASAFTLDNVEFEKLEEGAGDPEEETVDAGLPNDDEADEPSPDYQDESNPFFMPKKAKSKAEAEADSKASYKDTSDAANDILRKMLERRRASRP